MIFSLYRIKTIQPIQIQSTNFTGASIDQNLQEL